MTKTDKPVSIDVIGDEYRLSISAQCPVCGNASTHFMSLWEVENYKLVQCYSHLCDARFVIVTQLHATVTALAVEVETSAAPPPSDLNSRQDELEF